METYPRDPLMSKQNRLYLFIFSASLLIAGVLSFYASSSPDGLEKVADDTGFLENAKDSATSNSPLAGYQVSDLNHERFSVGLSGIIGVLVTSIFAYGLFVFLKKLNKGSKN